MLDTQGPEIRTGKNKDGKPIELKEGQILEISTDLDIEGTDTLIGCNYESLPGSVEIGGTVFIQDA
jgi:pyruvate kinase